MTILKVKIEDSPGTDIPWVYPVGEATIPLFMFVTSGNIGVPAWRWEKEVEPILKALGWSWQLDHLSSLMPKALNQ